MSEVRVRLKSSRCHHCANRFLAAVTIGFALLRRRRRTRAGIIRHDVRNGYVTLYVTYARLAGYLYGYRHNEHNERTSSFCSVLSFYLNRTVRRVQSIDLM